MGKQVPGAVNRSKSETPFFPSLPSLKSVVIYIRPYFEVTQLNPFRFSSKRVFDQEKESENGE
jgi:hypothetical protein